MVREEGGTDMEKTEDEQEDMEMKETEQKKESGFKRGCDRRRLGADRDEKQISESGSDTEDAET